MLSEFHVLKTHAFMCNMLIAVLNIGLCWQTTFVQIVHRNTALDMCMMVSEKLGKLSPTFFLATSWSQSNH